MAFLRFYRGVGCGKLFDFGGVFGSFGGVLGLLWAWLGLGLWGAWECLRGACGLTWFVGGC